MKIINCILFFFLLVTMIYLFSRPPIYERDEKEIIIYQDSIVKDTVRDTTFKFVTNSVVKYDTLFVNDTIYQRLPISRYEFKDTSYRFVVEGYKVKPIFFETYPITHYVVTERIKEITKQKRFTSGFNVGVGTFYGTKGLDIGFYAGYGITVRF